VCRLPLAMICDSLSDVMKACEVAIAAISICGSYLNFSNFQEFCVASTININAADTASSFCVIVTSYVEYVLIST